MNSVGLQVLPALAVVSMSAGVRVVLIVLIALLLAVAGFLVAFALLIRRKGFEITVFHPDSVGMPAPSGEAEPTGGTVVCQTCFGEFDDSVIYCPHDARRLVPVSEVFAPRQKEKAFCANCRSSFDGNHTHCDTHCDDHREDFGAPIAVFHSEESGKLHQAVGVAGKICPRCSERFDLSATFCGRDGAALVVLN